MEITTPRIPTTELIVTDIDNTIFDWVAYYSRAFTALLEAVAETTAIPFETLALEAREVFANHGSIEYPFVIQEMPSVSAFFQDDITGLLERAVTPARQRFKEAAAPYLIPYAGVADALAVIRRTHPTVPIVALTDAPRYVAMWKLNKLGLLSYFDAVYGLPDPKLPTCDRLGVVKVGADILLKHLRQSNFGFKGRIRPLPDEYEKPGVRGLKTVLMDYELDEPREGRNRVLWIGDNRLKDVELGRRVGVVTAWAAYGASIDSHDLERLLRFSPPKSIAQKNAPLRPGHQVDSPPCDIVLESFADVLKWLPASGIGVV